MMPNVTEFWTCRFRDRKLNCNQKLHIVAKCAQKRRVLLRLVAVCSATVSIVSFLACERSSQSGSTTQSGRSQVSTRQTVTATDEADTPLASPPGAVKLKPALQPMFELIRDRQTGPARVRLKNYLNANPNDGQANFLFGLSYHREQKYMQAMPYYDKSLALDPKFFLTHHFRGWALYYMGDLDASHASFETFLQAMPDEPDSLFALGLIALDEDDLATAETRLNRSLEVLQSQGPEADRKALSKAHTRLGEVYERTGRLDDAVAQMTLAVQLFPDHYEAYYKLSRVMARLGRTEEVQQAYDTYEATRNRIRPGTSFPE